MPSTRPLARGRAVALVAAGLLALVAGLMVTAAAPAAAHVTISPEEAPAGSTAVLTMSVAHGCDGSPTTRLAVRVPEGVLSVSPTRNPLWDVRSVVRRLDEPATDAHGNEVTERVAEVVYSAREPLPDGERDTFELVVQLPDTPGGTLAFPVLQSCRDGETAWVETTEGDPEQLEAPAPTVTLTGAQEAEDGEGSAAADRSDTLAVAALVAGLLGLAAGAGALVVAFSLARRRP